MTDVKIGSLEDTFAEYYAHKAIFKNSSDEIGAKTFGKLDAAVVDADGKTWTLATKKKQKAQAFRLVDPSKEIPIRGKLREIEKTMMFHPGYRALAKHMRTKFTKIRDGHLEILKGSLEKYSKVDKKALSKKAKELERETAAWNKANPDGPKRKVPKVTHKSMGHRQLPKEQWWYDPHDERPLSKINALVIHQAGGLMSGMTTFNQKRTGTHFWLLQDGRILPYQDLTTVAVHGNQTNTYSIGIDMVHPGIGGEARIHYPYEAAQLESLARLARRLCDQFEIPVDRIAGHKQVKPGNHVDPGKGFDWAKLRLRMGELMLGSAADALAFTATTKITIVAVPNGTSDVVTYAHERSAHLLVRSGVETAVYDPDDRTELVIVVDLPGTPDMGVWARLLEPIVYACLRSETTPTQIVHYDRTNAQLASVVDDAIYRAWRVIRCNDMDRTVLTGNFRTPTQAYQPKLEGGTRGRKAQAKREADKKMLDDRPHQNPVDKPGPRADAKPHRRYIVRSLA